MPLWKNNNNANSAPLFVTDAATGETGKQEYGTGEMLYVYGSEGYPVPAGWASKKVRGNRTFWESMVPLNTGGGFIPPFGFVFLTDKDGAYLIDQDGYYLVEAA